MNQTIKRILEAVFTGLLLLVVIIGLSKVTMRKDSDFKYKPFFEENTNFDVVFLGSSHMLNGVLPMELWKEYGITSYNFGGHGNRIATNYWVLQNILEYKKPKVVVLDVLYADADEKYTHAVDDHGISQAHLSLDAFPLSYTKYKAIQDIFDDTDRKTEFLFPFENYHGRWEELTQDDFEDNVTVEMGAESRVQVATPIPFHLISETEKKENYSVSYQYLQKTIDLCKENNIEILLTFLPFPADEGNQMMANNVADLAQKNQVKYVNFMHVESIVDFQTDCYDESSHLNPSGAKKVTHYLGEYLNNHYQIGEKTSPAENHRWNGYYETYLNYKKEIIENYSGLYEILMLLHDNDFSCDISVPDKDMFMRDTIVSKLVQNITALNSFIQNESLEYIKVVVFDKQSGEEILSRRYVMEENWNYELVEN